MKIKNVKVYGLHESIVRSGYPHLVGEPNEVVPTEKGFERAVKLANAPNGSGHDNFLKGIIVQFDLQYPEYFSPQLQRYHWVDIVSSQSKMHKLTSRELTKEDFTDKTNDIIILYLNRLIRSYNRKPSSELFNKIISNLPCGYLKWMAISTNYLQLKTIYKQRRSHKLTEWQYFCNWIKTLPMSNLITQKQ